MKPHRNVVVRYVYPAGPELELLEQCDDLVVRAASGDARALSAVVVTYGEVLLGVARRELGELWGEDAEDVVQENLRGDGARDAGPGGVGAGAGGGAAVAEEARAGAGVGAAGGKLARGAAAGERAKEVPVVSAGHSVVLPFIATATDDEVRDLFDELLGKAVGGDRRAIGAIAIALGPTLYKEARHALGKGREHEAGDVVQRLFLAMTEGTLRFSGERGTGLEWMKRIVRQGARGGSARRRYP